MKSPSNSGSFSAVSTVTIATKYSFCSIFDFSRSTRFSYFCTARISKNQQKLVNFLPEWKKSFHEWNEISFHSFFSMNFAILLRNFDDFEAEFHRNTQEMTECLEILKKHARKIRKMLEIYGIYEKIHFPFHFFNPLLSDHFGLWISGAGSNEPPSDAISQITRRSHLPTTKTGFFGRRRRHRGYQ